MDTRDGEGVAVTRQQIGCFIADMQSRGRAKNSLEKYLRDLTRLYQFLPPEKRIGRETLERWRAALLEAGYSPRTVNASVSEANSFLAWLGHRELQVARQLAVREEAQPELTRNEYLRLLSAARALGRQRTYLMVKTFAALGLTVQELPRLTVEAVEETGAVTADAGGRRQVQIPGCLRRELRDYIRQEGLDAGPVFVTRYGKLLRRTQVTAQIQALAREAQVAPEKCNPRCLRKLHQTAMTGIEADVRRLAERTYERLLEAEQLTVGWEEASGA